MTPRPLTILLLLLAGAVVNGAIAWACALWAPLPLGGLSDGREYTPRQLPGHWSAEATHWTYSGFGLDQVYSFESEVDGDVTRTTTQLTLRAGVPLRALQHVRRGFETTRPRLLSEPHINYGPSVTPWQPSRNASEGLTIPAWVPLDGGRMFHFLPVLPIWHGVLANTLFYAALLWLLFIIAPRQIRRLIRARRGRCPACAYPVGESAVCTECGRTVGKTTT